MHRTEIAERFSVKCNKRETSSFATFVKRGASRQAARNVPQRADKVEAKVDIRRIDRNKHELASTVEAPTNVWHDPATRRIVVGHLLKSIVVTIWQLRKSRKRWLQIWTGCCDIDLWR